MKLSVMAFIFCISAFADAGEFDCKIKVVKDDKALANIEFVQHFGATMGSVYIKPVSSKKNVLGKVVKEVKLVLEGFIQYGGELDGSSQMDLYLSLDTISYKRSSSTSRLELARIQGEGTQVVNVSAEGYTVTGGCNFVP